MANDSLVRWQGISNDTEAGGKCVVDSRQILVLTTTVNNPEMTGDRNACRQALYVFDGPVVSVSDQNHIDVVDLILWLKSTFKLRGIVKYITHTFMSSKVSNTLPPPVSICLIR